MTAKSRAKTDDEATDGQQAVREAPAKEPAPVCGKPHHLPQLAGHIACTEPAEELEPGAPEHEHRYQDGDALYTW
jgi:hypothetical protein